MRSARTQPEAHLSPAACFTGNLVCAKRLGPRFYRLPAASLPYFHRSSSFTVVNTDGRLYGAVTAKDVSEKIGSELGLDIDKRLITISDTIKTTGEYTVRIKLFQGISAELKLIVEA